MTIKVPRREMLVETALPRSPSEKPRISRSALWPFQVIAIVRSLPSQLRSLPFRVIFSSP